MIKLSPLVFLWMVVGCASPDTHLAIVMNHGTTAQLFVNGFVGDKPTRFFLDTGAVRSSLISEGDIKSLPATGVSRLGGVSLTPQVCDWVTVDSFRISGWHYAPARFSRCDDQGTGNVLGLDFMRHALSLNLERAVFSLKGPAPREVRLKPFTRNHFGMPMIPIKVAGQPVVALFDTGCGMTVVDQAIVDANPKGFKAYKALVGGEKRQGESSFKDSSGQKVVGRAYTATDIEIEGIPKSAQLVTAIPFGKELKGKLQASIILGVNSMLTANWFLDFEKNQWAAYAFSPKMVKLPFLQIPEGQVTREDDLKMTVRGGAKIASDDDWLSGPQITIDLKKKIAHCESDCTFAQGQSRFYVSPVDIDISEKSWSKIDPDAP